MMVRNGNGLQNGFLKTVQDEHISNNLFKFGLGFCEILEKCAAIRNYFRKLLSIF